MRTACFCYTQRAMVKTIVLGAGILVLLGAGWWFLSGGAASGGTLSAGTSSIATATETSGPVATSTSATTTNPTKNIMSATLHTSMGDITIEFFPAQAPNTVANFIKLAQQGFYDGTKFHRVIKGFMIQGGDPLTKDDSKMALWGTGGPGYTFPDEIGPNNDNAMGTIAMANSGPNTNGSQFFINAVNNPSLNSGYTVFGKVTAGLSVVESINSVPTDSSDRPLTPVVLQSITLQ